MSTLQTLDEGAVQIDPQDGRHYTTVQEEGAEYITIAEYIRRRHEAALKLDLLARPLYDTNIRRASRRGDIVLFKQGIHFFIDWNKYKTFVFLQYGQIPKQKEPKARARKKK